MSKILYLVRHAKSSWKDEKLEDWKRPLLEAGIKRAVKVSKILKRNKIYPDKIISSHAFRALNTSVLFSLSLNYPVNEIEINYNIYGKSTHIIGELIRKQHKSTKSLMLVGHNPMFTELYNNLTGENLKNLKTSAVACIRFKTDEWAKIYQKKGQTMFLETGK